MEVYDGAFNRDAIDLFGNPLLEMTLAKINIYVEENKKIEDSEMILLNIVEGLPFFSVFQGFVGLISENTGDLLAVVDTAGHIFYQINDTEIYLPDSIVFCPFDKTIIN